MTKKMVDPIGSQEDYWLWEALFKLSNLILTIEKETDPEHYAWMMKWNRALKKERLAREERLKIESEEPPMK